MNEEQKKSYLINNGMLCPYCKSRELYSYQPEISESGIRHHTVCDECKKSWTEVYTLTDVEVDEE